MRRADRLFRIVEYLKARRRAVTAADLAAELEVSIRTVYRDMADLTLSGVPILGEAGVGYMLDKDYIVRPLMFDVEELDALMLGAQMVKSWSDPDLAAAASRAVDKIGTVLPPNLHDDMLSAALYAGPSQSRKPITVDFAALRRAIRSRNIVTFDYLRLDEVPSSRRARPLALAFFGPVWLFVSWCEMRQDFRNFRIDRMSNLNVTGDKFTPERGKRLQDYEEIMRREHKMEKQQSNSGNPP